ncbi:hypothetical protein CH371_16010 [Leptospira wolffii]|uniref:Uncharacterized protein n=1 Tax=Leptospira wolffii TaxID=409998 RepID=A0A2M9Z9H5_9LEPT|nr:serine hydrolase [Leptospira wolffii]PJZ65002.1 hypothetical protein CH371_16010 [Leptospira wolffii]
MRSQLAFLALILSIIGCSAPNSSSMDSAALLLSISSEQTPTPFTVVATGQQAKLDAVEQTATTNAFCTALGSFYWEIGDKNGSYGFSSVAGSTNASTSMLIASASKWIWGAYVLQKVGTPGTNEKSYLRMLSNYDNLSDSSCNLTLTVNACFTAGPGNDGTNNNNYLDSVNANKYYYNGGHFQAYAALNPSGLTPSLTNFTRAQLAAEVANTLFSGSNPGISYAVPQPAGGVITNASVYASFLRRILNSDITMGSYLGADPVVTHPDKNPTAAAYSPFRITATQEETHYSYGHWIEDSTGNDGSYSSPGKFGFYPWIDPSNSTYGILARYSTSGLAYLQSVYCGRLLRKAFQTGVAQ